jgi:uncharacterized membrane protein
MTFVDMLLSFFGEAHHATSTIFGLRTIDFLPSIRQTIIPQRVQQDMKAFVEFASFSQSIRTKFAGILLFYKLCRLRVFSFSQCSRATASAQSPACRSIEVAAGFQ